MAWWDDVGKFAANNWDKALYLAPGVGQVYGLADQLTGGALGKGVREKTAQFGNWVAKDLPKDLGFAPSDIGSQFAQPDTSLAGIPGYAGMQAQGQQMMGEDRNRTFSPEIRSGQNQLASQLWGQVRGTEPSLAQAQLQKGTDANIAQAMAMARSQRGLGAAGQMRQIDMQRAQAGQQMAQDAGILRLQEQASAQQQLGGLYNQMGGQDLQQGQMNDQQVRFYLSQGASLAEAQQRATMDMEKFRVDSQNQAVMAQYGENRRASGQVLGFIKGLSETAMGAATGGAPGAAMAGIQQVQSGQPPPTRGQQVSSSSIELRGRGRGGYLQS
jgi:hypothetical protein